MKKSLLFIVFAALSSGAIAQTPSPFWQKQNANYAIPSAGTRYMHVVNSNVVWAVGYDGTSPNANHNEFTRTINGGTNYNSGLIYPDTLTYHPSSIEGIDANTAWVTAYLNTTQNKGAIHTTTNGGVTWTNVTPINMYTATAAFADITCFLTPSVGITMGDPVSGEFEIHRTTNGGQTWTKLPGTSIANPVGGEYGLTDVYTKFGTNDIWFGTNVGRVYHSNDAGLTWSAASIGLSVYINKLAFRDAMNGILITSNSTVYRTNNGGSSWTQITPLDPNMGLNSVCAIPGTNWFASCGAGTGNTIISWSNDDGTTWNSWGGSQIQYLEIDFASNTAGFAGGFSDPTNPAIDGMFKYTGGPLGINNTFAPLAEAAIYPNPSTGLITIKLAPSKEGATIVVVDALGKTVLTENVKNMTYENHSINLEGLAKGIYSVTILRPTGSEVKKITIQ